MPRYTPKQGNFVTLTSIPRRITSRSREVLRKARHSDASRLREAVPVQLDALDFVQDLGPTGRVRTGSPDTAGSDASLAPQGGFNSRQDRLIVVKPLR